MRSLSVTGLVVAGIQNWKVAGGRWYPVLVSGLVVAGIRSLYPEVVDGLLLFGIQNW